MGFRKSDYYHVLKEGQKNHYSEDERIDAWLLFFFECLVTLTQHLDAKYNSFKAKGGYLNDRQMAVLEFIKRNQPVKVADVAKNLSGFSINTIRKDLLYLRDENEITSIGVGRGTVYIIEEKD